MSESVLGRGYLAGTGLYLSGERAESPAREAMLVLLIILAASVLAFLGLDNNYFWDDEAQVALFAKRYLEGFGWSAWDGRNFFGYRNGVLVDESGNISRLMPPLMFWTCVASFKWLGVSTWSARFPFVIAGLLSLFVFWRVARRDLDRPRAAVIAVALLALCPGFLVAIRQCRYYSFVMLFGLLVYWAYQRILVEPRRRDYALLVLSAVGLFYSSYLLFVAFGLGLAIKGLLFDRQLFIERFFSSRGLVALALIALPTLPYFVAYRLWVSPDNFGHPRWLWYRPKQILNYTRDINLIGTLPWTIWLFALWRGAVVKDPWLRRALPWVALTMANAFVMALVTPQPRSVFADTRYLLMSLVFGAGVTAFVVEWAWERSRAAGAALVVTLLCTNALAMHPLHHMEFRVLLPAYIQEITAPYPTSIEKLVDYLKVNAKQDETVYTEPEYFNYPLAFYLGDKIKICCMLRSDTPLDPKRVADPRAFFDKASPDWLVGFGDFGPTQGAVDHFSGVRGAPYKKVASLNVYWLQTQRGELHEHHFGPVTRFDPSSQGVYLFRADSK